MMKKVIDMAKLQLSSATHVCENDLLKNIMVMKSIEISNVAVTSRNRRS